MRIAGLFAGIGGLELGMHRSGHTTELLCDVLPAARAVLNARFPGVPYRDDITKLRSLPGSVDLLCAGFPCQDLSQAGRTAGLDGERSGLIGEVFRLLSRRRVPTVVVENVPFMLQLNGGNAIRAIVDEFGHEELLLLHVAHQGIEAARREDTVLREDGKVALLRILREVADLTATYDGAGVRLGLTGQDPQRGGLARTVAADEADPVTGADAQHRVGRRQQGPGARADFEVSGGDHDQSSLRSALGGSEIVRRAASLP